MKIELHTHSKEISNCGHLSVEELTDLYVAAKYDVMLLCNHFNTMTAKILAERGTDDFHKAYFDCVDHAVEVGKSKGLLVLGGCELRFDHNENDYLVYGMTPEMCKDWRTICAMKEKDFSEFAAVNGLLFYQASSLDISLVSKHSGVTPSDGMSDQGSRQMYSASEYGAFQIA